MEDNKKSPEELEKIHYQQEQFASIKRMILKQINNAIQSTPTVLSKFDSKQVAIWLQSPSKHEKKLRDLSNYLYNVNAQYKMLIRHMSTMPTYDYELDLIGSVRNYAPDKVEKALLKTSQYIDKLNLKHEMSKMLKIAFKEDVYFGYEHESKDSYFIQKLNPDYCQIGTAIEDGVLNFDFDFSYFDTYKADLLLFPQEFREKYQIYLNDKIKYRWQELDSNKAVCFKINEELSYALPPFNTIFESIFDLDEYKKLKKAKTKMDNFMLLVQKIPMSDKADIDGGFLIDPKIANQFHENTAANLSPGIGLTTTPMDIEAISLDKKQNSADTVNEAVREVFTDSGVSQYLFNSDKNTSVGISKSIMADEQIIFDVYRQLERWLNRKLKRMPGAIKFHLKFFNITEYSRKEFFERELKAAQFGTSTPTRVGATLGMSPNQFYNKVVIDNEILGLHDIIRPLQSSHTQNGKNDSEGGAPEKSENEVSDSRQVDLDNSDD